MHWTNYRKLVNYLKTMDPRLFDYGLNPDPHDDGYPCGCVETHCDVLSGHDEGILEFLGITDGEANYLFGLESPEIDPAAEHYKTLEQDFRATGKAGIREALRRLDVVAARYGGCPDEIAPSTFQPNDQKFLASVRALIGAPVEAE